MKTYEKVGTAGLRPLAMSWFLFRRSVTHDLFVRQRGLPGARLWLRPFGFVFKAGGVVARCWRAASTSAALEVYSGTLARHYGPRGLAYSHLAATSDDDRRARFDQQQGRIRFYMVDRRVLDLSNGDSFLDCGCGPGQNIVELRRAFPGSPIKAFDFNAEAVATARAGSTGDPLTTVEQGSVLDAGYLASYPAGSFDHVIMSHVMGFLVQPTLEETRVVRQRIVDEMVRIARRSVIVLDAVEIKRPTLSVTIEQRDRGIVHDDLTRYFQPHANVGRVYVMLSPEDEAIVYRKTPPAAVTSTI